MVWGCMKYWLCEIWGSNNGVGSISHRPALAGRWEINKERQKNDAFELWTWRRILRFPWTARRTKVSVLEEVQPKRPLEATILRLKLRYFGHVMRAKGSLERDIMLGQSAGHRRQGKPRMRWLDSIEGATGLRLEVLKEIVQDRKNGACWWKKRLEIGNAQTWNVPSRRQWQTTPEH